MDNITSLNQEMNTLWRVLAEVTADALFVKDRQGKYLLINPAGAALVGRPIETIIGKDDTELFSLESAERSIARDHRVMDMGVIETYEETASADGVERTYFSTKGPYRDRTGAIVGLVGISRDITEHKRTIEDLRRSEEDLRRSEERFRATVDQAAVGIAHTDLAGHWQLLNEHLCTMYGYTSEELLGRHFRDVTHPDDLEGDLEQMRRLVTGEIGSYAMEKRYIRRDGSQFWGHLTVSLVRDGNGRPSYVIAVVEDVSQRKQSEEERLDLAARARAARAELEATSMVRVVMDASPVPIYSLDRAGKVMTWNTAAEQTLGWSREEVVGRTPSTVPIELLPEATTWFEEVMAGKTVSGIESRRRCKDGSEIDASLSLAPLCDTAGHIQGAIVVVTDITDHKRAEEELRARERKQAAIARLGQRAIERPDLSELFRDTAALIRLTLGATCSSILELSSDRATLSLRARAGWRGRMPSRLRLDAGASSLAGYTLLCGNPILVDDLAVESRFTVCEGLLKRSLTSAISAVIAGQDRPFGVLSAFSTRKQAFSQDDVHFLQAATHVLSAAIERKQLEEERSHHSMEVATYVMNAQEEERRRIARELHDETAQSLSSLLINLDLLESQLPRKDTSLRAGFERVRELARRTLDETRALSHDLRPTILDDVGLVAALEWFAAEHRQTFGNHVTVRAQQTRRLPPEIEVALFRIAQEALTNIGKHAHADSIDLSLSFPDSSARLIVEDDGCGFDPSKVDRPSREGRLGLYGMHERAALLGGTLVVQSAPGEGTRVTAELPVDYTFNAPRRRATDRA